MKKHCSTENFLTEFTLESEARTTRGLVLGGLISLKYSPFDEFISKTFSKKIDGDVFQNLTPTRFIMRHSTYL